MNHRHSMYNCRTQTCQTVRLYWSWYEQTLTFVQLDMRDMHSINVLVWRFPSQALIERCNRPPHHCELTTHLVYVPPQRKTAPPQMVSSSSNPDVAILAPHCDTQCRGAAGHGVLWSVNARRRITRLGPLRRSTSKQERRWSRPRSSIMGVLWGKDGRRLRACSRSLWRRI